MTKSETPRVLQNVWKAVLAWGVLTLILGVVILVWPGISIGVAAVLFGAVHALMVRSQSSEYGVQSLSDAHFAPMPALTPPDEPSPPQEAKIDPTPSKAKHTQERFISFMSQPYFRSPGVSAHEAPSCRRIKQAFGR